MDAADRPVTVTLLANAGLRIAWGRHVLLLDALFDGDTAPFSPLPTGCLDAMCSGAPPFENTDYLLFSHRHADHYSPEALRRFLSRRKIRGLVLPPDAADDALVHFLADRKVPTLLAVSGSGSILYRFGEENASLRILPTAHLDQKYADVEHLCFLLTVGEKKLLFTGDADYVHETFPALAGEKLTAVFLNPLFFRALSDRRLFHGHLSSENYCVYHVPFAEDDTAHIRDTLQRDLLHWNGIGTATALTEHRQSIEL